MALDNRSEKMTLRLTADEVKLRDKLAEAHGVNGSSIMRMALRRFAKAENIEIEPAPKKKAPPPR